MDRIKAIYEEELAKVRPLQGLPHFRFRSRSPIEATLQVDLAVLALLPVLFFTWSYFTFVRREEGGRP